MSRCFISNPVLKEPTKFTLAPILSQIGMIFVSVSYTHLDVYKRQAQNTINKNRRTKEKYDNTSVR